MGFFVVGNLVGWVVGNFVGRLVGFCVGSLVGWTVGNFVGRLVGFCVGSLVGLEVGDCVVDPMVDLTPASTSSVRGTSEFSSSKRRPAESSSLPLMKALWRTWAPAHFSGAAAAMPSATSTREASNATHHSRANFPRTCTRQLLPSIFSISEPSPRADRSEWAGRRAVTCLLLLPAS